MSRRDLSEGRRPKRTLQKTSKNKGNSTYIILVIYFIIKAGRITVQRITKKARKANRSKGDRVIQNLISFIEVRIQIQRKLHQIWIQIQRKLHQIEIQIQRKLHQIQKDVRSINTISINTRIIQEDPTVPGIIFPLLPR
jgi:esterase/lipase